MPLTRRRGPSGRTLFWVAAALGTLHALPSLYWALGGWRLLTTVGEWAVDLSASRPVLAGVALGLVTVAKLAGAWIPLAAEYGRIAGRRWWRAVGWAGGVGLVLYGGANVLVSGAVLAGLLPQPPEGPTDGTVGHALLWGPLFLLWGAALVAALALTRDRSHHAPRP